MSYRALMMLALCAPLLAASAQAAPRWRSLDVSRQLRDTAPQRIKVQYDAGRVDVRPTNAALLVWAPLAATVVRAAAIAASWAALTLGLGAAILSRAGTHRRVASGSRPVELAAWQTPTPVTGVVAARRPAAVAKEAP